jgi:hypothetical protein
VRSYDSDKVANLHRELHSIALVELPIAAGKIDAGDWSWALGAELDQQPAKTAADAGAAYCSAFLRALEHILDRSQLALRAEVDRREQDWRSACLNTPHGKPVSPAH